jgi:hypothetical protein
MALVQSFSAGSLDALLQTKWSAVETALQAGNVAGAIQYFALAKRGTYANIFSSLTIPIPAFGQLLSGITFDHETGFNVEYHMTVVENNVPYSEEVIFVLDADGIWRIKFF